MVRSTCRKPYIRCPRDRGKMSVTWYFLISQRAYTTTSYPDIDRESVLRTFVMKSMAIFHFQLTLCILLTAAARASPLHPFDDPSALHDRHNSSGIIQPRPLTPHLNRRSAINLGDGWWMFYDSYTSLLPWQDAAEGIGEFFETIQEKANSVWQERNPQHYLNVVKGDLKIEFFSQLRPIPWPFVAEFADTMCRAINRGFANMFDVRVVGPTGVVVYVHLRVRLALLAAGAA